jgi:hypothetical protein
MKKSHNNKGDERGKEEEEEEEEEMFHATTKLMKETEKKKKTCDATTKFMKEAKRIDTTTADCRCHQITIPRHRDLSKKHKINNNNNIKLQNRMSPFPQRKIF